MATVSGYTKTQADTLLAGKDAAGAAATAQAASAQKSANLSDLASASTARTNLGLGTAATQPSTAFLGATAQAADSAKINGIAVTGTPSSGMVPIASSSTAAVWGTLGITGQYIGSAATFSGLPTTDGSGYAASNGDWAFLTADVVGTGSTTAPQYPRGAYVYNGSTYSLGMTLGADFVIGTGAGTVAAGNDSRIVGAAQASNNLSDIASAPAARTALGLGTAAVQQSSAFDAAGSAAPANFYRGGASDLSRAFSSKPLFVSAYQSVPTAQSTSAAVFTFRATHTLTQAVAGFRLVLPLGFNVSSGQTAADVIWTGSTPVKVSVEIGGVIRPVTWWGTRTKTADPGGVLVSDVIAADLPSGTQVPVRVNIPTSTLYPNTVGTAQGPGATATGDGYTNGSDTSDSLTAVGVAITAGYFCHGLISTPVSSPRPTFAFLGDSITAGTGDATNNGGWTAYLSNGTVPNLRLAVAGAAAQGWVGAHTYSWPYLDYCTHAVVMLGANDLTTGNGPRTYAQFIADLTSIYTAMKGRGLKVYGCTVLPRTTSTDSWATTTNQTAASTAFAAGGSSVRGQANAWIRAGGGGLLNGYFETADVVESARDSGLWKASYTADGAHPVQTAHQAIATALASQFAALTV